MCLKRHNAPDALRAGVAAVQALQTVASMTNRLPGSSSLPLLLLLLLAPAVGLAAGEPALAQRPLPAASPQAGSTIRPPRPMASAPASQAPFSSSETGPSFTGTRSGLPGFAPGMSAPCVDCGRLSAVSDVFCGSCGARLAP